MKKRILILALVCAGGGVGKTETPGFVLQSPEVREGILPKDYTGDGSGATLPLEWSGAPAETKSYTVIMHHIDPKGGTKWYWTLYNIPAEIQSLPKNGEGIGILGNNSVNHQIGYAPPHSKGPGPKVYTITVYALSSPLEITLQPKEVSREILVNSMKEKILGFAELKVTYDRTKIIKNRLGKVHLKPREPQFTPSTKSCYHKRAAENFLVS